jgi:16S rRNA processing protein RimM
LEKDFFLIAKIISHYGKNGFVKIESYSDFPERFFQLNEVFVDFWGDKKKIFVEEVIKQRKFFALKFKNFDNEQEAEVFRGRDIYVEKKDVIKLPAGCYFVHDFVGSKVFQSGNEIGVINDVIHSPANDVIVIKGEKDKEILVPLVLEFIEKFDPENKKLVLKKDIVYDDED